MNTFFKITLALILASFLTGCSFIDFASGKNAVTDSSESIPSSSGTSSSSVHTFSAAEFVIYSDVVPESVDWLTSMTLDNWGSDVSVSYDTYPAPTERGNLYMIVQAQPNVVGWLALAFQAKLPTEFFDLSEYANGHLRFSLNGTKKLKVSLEDTNYSAIPPISLTSGNYGYTANGTWQQVSIPIASFVALGLDLSIVNACPVLVGDDDYDFNTIWYIDEIFITKD